MPTNPSCGPIYATLLTVSALTASVIPSLGATSIIAQTGDSAPGEYKIESFSSAPRIHNTGGPTIHVKLTGPDRRDAILQLGANRQEHRILAMTGMVTPDINGEIATLQASLVNGAGETALQTSLRDTLGGFRDNLAVYRVKNGASTLEEVLRKNYRFIDTDIRVSDFSILALNDAGRLAAFVQIASDSNPFESALGLFRIGEGEPYPIAVNRRQIPGLENQEFVDVTPNLFGVSIIETGEVGFLAETRNSDGSGRKLGYFKGNGTNTIRLVSHGDSTPSNNGKVSLDILSILSGARPAFNDLGDLALNAGVSGTDLGPVDNSAIFLVNSGVLKELVRKASFVPDRNGRFLSFYSDLRLNNRGDVLFAANISGATGGQSSGLFIGTPTNVIAVARLNDNAPGGGKFSKFTEDHFSFNDRAQIVFEADIDLENGGSQADRHGLFFYEPARDIRLAVARTGESFGSLSEITEIHFFSAPSFVGDSVRGFNDRGDVTFGIRAGNQESIALWSPTGIEDNRAPTSNGFEISFEQGSFIQIGISNLLSVVEDPDGDLLSFVSATQLTQEGFQLAYLPAQNSLRYSPRLDFLGVDKFSYVVRDDLGATVTVQGIIRITGPNRPPAASANALTFSVRPGESLVFEIATLIAASTDPDGDPIQLAELPGRTVNGGTIERVGNSITVIPILAGLPVRSDSFLYRVADGRGGEASIEVQIQEPIAPIVFDGFGLMKFVGQGFSISLTSNKGRWTIQRASSLSGPWTDLGEVDTSGGRAGRTVEFIDPNPPIEGSLYRAIR